MLAYTCSSNSFGPKRFSASLTVASQLWPLRKDMESSPDYRSEGPIIRLTRVAMTLCGLFGLFFVFNLPGGRVFLISTEPVCNCTEFVRLSTEFILACHNGRRSWSVAIEVNHDNLWNQFLCYFVLLLNKFKLEAYLQCKHQHHSPVINDYCFSLFITCCPELQDGASFALTGCLSPSMCVFYVRVLSAWVRFRGSAPALVVETRGPSQLSAQLSQPPRMERVFNSSQLKCRRLLVFCYRSSNYPERVNVFDMKAGNAQQPPFDLNSMLLHCFCEWR